MTSDMDKSRIVETWTDRDCGTGERMLRTADGRVWHECPTDLPPPGTGQSRGYVRDGYVVKT